MTRLYIPSLGDQLRLTVPWTFDLYGEHRNSSLFEVLGLKSPPPKNGYYDYDSRRVTLEAGSVLKVDRIYIRKGQSDFNSITFHLKGEKTKKRTQSYSSSWGGSGTYTIPSRGVRFWVKLADANNIEFERVVP